MLTTQFWRPKVSNSRELGHSADENSRYAIVVWSKAKFIHLDLLPTQMDFHSNYTDKLPVWIFQGNSTAMSKEQPCYFCVDTVQ